MVTRRQPQGKLKGIDTSDNVLSSFLSEIANYPVLSNEEINKLFSDREKNREKIVCSNLRLLVRIAKEFWSESISINDLIQEGYIGLEEAVKKFSTSFNVAFCSYAAWWIRNKILKYCNRYSSIVRYPDNWVSSTKHLLKMTSDFFDRNERIPTVDELMEISGYNRGIVNRFLCIQQEEEPKEEESYQIENLLSKDAIIKNIVKILSKEEMNFISKYYGIWEDKISQKDLAKHYLVTPKEIRRRKAEIINKLKEKLDG